MNLQVFAEDEGSEESENIQEVAEPETEAVESETETEGENEEVTEPHVQSPETNAAFANMRRRAEAAEKRAADLDAMYAKQYGKYTNPETGKPITSAADYFEAMAAQEEGESGDAEAG